MTNGHYIGTTVKFAFSVMCQWTLNDCKN